jgi:polyphosphate kinase 2 (PPK2 family)
MQTAAQKKDKPPITQEKLDGSMDQIRDMVQKVETDLTCVAPDKRFRKITKILKKKDKEEIVQAVLEKFYNAEELKPYQAELIKMQRHLENTGKKMVILFDGRDASGKGGTIRRLTRYMNEKRYRAVALGKPSEHQKTELHRNRLV